MKLLIEFSSNPLGTLLGTVMVPKVRCFVAEDFDSPRVELPMARLALVGGSKFTTLEEFARELERRRKLGYPLDVTVFFAGGYANFWRSDCKVLGGDYINGELCEQPRKALEATTLEGAR